MSTNENNDQRDSGGRSEQSERYNDWTNRETWAVALHINNDQGWQESVLEQLRDYREAADFAGEKTRDYRAGDIIRENVEETLETLWEFHSPELRNILTDVGSLWRVDWIELGRAFLSDLAEEETVSSS